jgi:hypothetical protein
VSSVAAAEGVIDERALTASALGGEKTKIPNTNREAKIIEVVAINGPCFGKYVFT